MIWNAGCDVFPAEILWLVSLLHMLSVEVIEMLIIRVGVDYRIKKIAVHDIKNILFLFGWQLN